MPIAELQLQKTFQERMRHTIQGSNIELEETDNAFPWLGDDS